jgi:hypothetical protein
MLLDVVELAYRNVRCLSLGVEGIDLLLLSPTP